MPDLTTSFSTVEPDGCDNHRRASDKLRLRELEIQTQYEIKYLSAAFTDLKTYVQDSLQKESDRFESVNKKLNILGIAILAQVAGIDLVMLFEVFKGL